MFAAMVAFSCFGALNGEDIYHDFNRRVASSLWDLFRLFIYDRTADLCGWERGLSSCALRTPQLPAQDAS